MSSDDANREGGGQGEGASDGKQESYQQRLFNIRMKINQGRKANNREVESEFKRLSSGKKEGYRNGDDNDSDNNNEDDKNTKSNNSDKSKKKKKKKGSFDIMNVTAEYAEVLKDKEDTKQRNTETYGLNSYNKRVVQKVYETDLKALPTFNSTNSGSGGSNGPSSLLDKQLTYGSLESSRVSKIGVDRLEKLLKLKEEKKNKSRKREFDAGDVDYINEKNAVFNKKIKKAFDKYTVEIKQNLERGTAI